MAEKRRCSSDEEEDMGEVSTKRPCSSWVPQKAEGEETTTLYFCEEYGIFYEKSADFYFKVDADGNPQETVPEDGMRFVEGQDDSARDDADSSPPTQPSGEGEETGAEGQSGTGGDAGTTTTTTGADGVQGPFRFYTESWTGHKETNEDRFVNNVALDGAGVLFGVFDGHGGPECADFVTANLGAYVRKHLEYVPSEDVVQARRIGAELTGQIRENKALIEQLQAQQSGDSAELITQLSELVALLEQQQRDCSGWDPALEAALKASCKNAFPDADKDFLDVAASNSWQSGSTAIVSIVAGFEGGWDGTRLVIANLGDSRAVLCRGLKGIALSRDHKPDRRDEQRRVTAAGGQVVNFGGIWRVGAVGKPEKGTPNLFLAVSRAFGDSPLKIPKALVSSEPELHVEELQEHDFFFVLACDGIFDVLSDQEVVDIAREHFGQPEKAAAGIVRRAFSKGSEDNLTATVVEFAWHTREAYLAFEEAQKAAPQPGHVVDDLDIFG